MWREPLVHFLVLGALLFLAFQWRGADGPGSNRIVLTPGQIEALAAGFARTWQRPPTDEELKGLIDDHVRDEIATREAMALGLDRDDTVIRRRLRQKLEFAAEDAIDATPPTEADLQSWLDQNAAKYQTDPQVAFRQVYLSPDRRGAAVEEDARKLLARLSGARPDAPTDTVGDVLMLPGEMPLSSRTEVARQFGEEFADALLVQEPGRWAGPVRSGYGLHLVHVRERIDGRLPLLADVRQLVERDFMAARRRQRLDAMYERLLQRYRVTVEPRTAAPRPAGELPVAESRAGEPPAARPADAPGGSK